MSRLADGRRDVREAVCQRAASTPAMILTSTAPAAWAGVTAVTVVEFTTFTDVAATRRTSRCRAGEPRSVSVTPTPPAALPVFAVTLVNVLEEVYVKPFASVAPPQAC